MTIVSELIQEIQKKLEPRYHDSLLCEQYAWWMVQTITKKDKNILIAEKIITLSDHEARILHEWIEKQVVQKMPLAYLLGSVPFNDVIIHVKPPVLIPRLETEQWCIELINSLKQLQNQKLTILDLCTGSGCIALAFAKAFPKAQIFATDISDQALDLARRNAQLNHLNTITFIKSDLFNEIPLSFTFDLIVANPPYIAPNEWQQLDDSVKKWEDKHALVAHDNGLALIKKIIAQAPRYLKQNQEMHDINCNQLFIEIGYQQGPAVIPIFKEYGFNNITIDKDLAGNDRIVSARIDNVAFNKQLP